MVDDARGAPEPSGEGGQQQQQQQASELETIASRTAYDSFLAAAQAVEPGFIEPCGVDVVLAYHAVVRGVENVVGGGAVVIGRLPNVDLVQLSSLPRLAQGLVYAELLVERELQAAAASFGPLFDRAQQLRRKLRKTADALAEAQLLSDADVEEVWLRAQQDVLEDFASLTALLRRNETRIAGRSPVTAGELLEAEQLAGQLRMMFGQVPEGGASASRTLTRALEMRDRFWTLVAQRHEMLWRCGAWLHGRAVEERVPPLPARRSGTRRVLSAQALRMTEPRALEPAPVSLPEPKRALPPPRALVPASFTPAVAPVPQQPSRHLADLERKARFLLRIGVTATTRR